jgi:CsoR family transcriptional regulator, copper-sensing transcriptional repressor
MSHAPPEGEAPPHESPGSARAQMRLRRIEGQVRGVQRMIEEGRYCPEILIQIASIQKALHGVSREVMRDHLAHCAAAAEREGGQAAESMRGELLDLIYKYLR